MFAVRPPADRRVVSAVRRFPPGCGRPCNATAQNLPRQLPSSTTKPPAPNPSASVAATMVSPSPRRNVPAVTYSATLGTDCGAGNVNEAVVKVTVRRVSAVRTYPPGCGRGVAVAGAVPKPPALVVECEFEAGTRKPPAELCIEAKAKSCDKDAVLCECAIDDGEVNSDGGMESGGGDGDAAAQEEACGDPLVVMGPIAVPFLPWAQRRRRSQRGKRSQRPKA